MRARKTKSFQNLSFRSDFNIKTSKTQRFFKKKLSEFHSARSCGAIGTTIGTIIGTAIGTTSGTPIGTIIGTTIGTVSVQTRLTFGIACTTYVSSAAVGWYPNLSIMSLLKRA